MRELRYGRHMLNYDCGNGDLIKWIFPENINIRTSTLYEVEYQEIDGSDPSDFSRIYKVAHIKPVSAFIERINYIVNVFNQTNRVDAFEKWFREHYKLLVVK